MKATTVIVPDVDGVTVDHSDHLCIAPSGGVGVPMMGVHEETSRQQPRENTRTAARRIRIIGSLFALDLGLFHIETLSIWGRRRTA